MVSLFVIFACRKKSKGTMKTEEKYKDDIAGLIINAAQKRFGIYGVQKTTMREIANDLNISKAALYYYFPDKESLYNEIITREQKEFLRNLEEEIGNLDDPAESLRKYAMGRLSYFRKLLNLSRIRLAYMADLKPLIAESHRNFHEEEKNLIMTILEKGRKEGLFMINDTDRTATLYLDLLRGLRRAYMAVRDPIVIDETEFKEFSERVNDITVIFINGLKCRNK